MKNKEVKNKEYRGVVDEIREQQKKMKDMTFKEKLSYFWYYYKVHVLVTIVVVAFLGNWIYEVATAKDFNFYGIMLNSSYLDSEPLEASFAEYAQLDTENYECYIDTLSTLSYSQQSEYDFSTFNKLVALVQTKDLDIMVLDGQVCYNFSTNGMVADLRTILTEEDLAAYEGNIYYIDYAKVREAEEADDTDTEILAEYEKRNSATPEEAAAEAESHRYPETMAEPVPVGIFIADSPFVQKTGCYSKLVPIFTFSSTGQRAETGKQYLEFIWNNEIPFENMITYY